MSDVAEVKKPSYREMMSSVSGIDKAEDRMPENYLSDLPIIVGMVAGVIGSFAIIAVITLLALAAGQDIFLSPRVIASVILGDSAFTGALPIVVGTVMHIGAGIFYGALFAFAMPKMPRAFWFVAGIIFSVVIWGIAAFLLPFLIPENQIAPNVYTNALIISHITYGITLGLAGSAYGINRRR